MEISGIQLFAPNEDDPRFAAWVQMVRVLRNRPNARVIGLLPATRRIGGWAAALQLGVALHYVTGEPVTIVDCNNQKPAFLNEPGLQEGAEYYRREAQPGVWIAGSTKPMRKIDLAWWQPLREAALRQEHYVLCDLSGFTESSMLGAILNAFDCLATLAVPGKVWEWQLSRLHKLFPREKDAGVLFLEPFTPRRRWFTFWRSKRTRG